jgi:KaiC/GvpD/RAD55 family RecA-like ATPase
LNSRHERVRTGIAKLDDLLSGGFPENATILLSGPPGSGKTILCYQFLHAGLEEGDKCLFLSVGKKVEGVLDQARAIGLDFEQSIEKGQIKFLFLNINKRLVYESLVSEILSGYNRVVIDSITPLSELPIYSSTLTNEFPNGEKTRMRLHFIIDTLATAKCTSIITSELPYGSTELSRDGISEFLVDGVILLDVDPTMGRRKLSIVKMRSTKHTLKPQEIEIREKGIRII